MTKEEVKKLLEDRIAKYRDTIETIGAIKALDGRSKKAGDVSMKKFDLSEACDIVIEELQYIIDHNLKDFDDRPDEVSKGEFVCKYVKNLLDVKAHDAYTYVAIKQLFQEAEDLYDRDMFLHKKDACAKCNLSMYEKPTHADNDYRYALVGKYIVPNCETNKMKLCGTDIFCLKSLYKVKSFDGNAYTIEVKKSKQHSGCISAAPSMIKLDYHVVEVPAEIM